MLDPRSTPTGADVIAVSTLLSELPLVVTADHVAQLFQVDVKVIYSAVADLGLPMRRIGRRKCLRGLTLAVLLWLVGRWPPGLDSGGQGCAVSNAKER